MRSVFADASYWIALLNPRDTLHERAAMASASLGQARLVTSEMVLTELLNDFGMRNAGLRRIAMQAIQPLRDDRRVAIIPQTSALFHQALGLYAAREDKAWSLTDCASFRIMEGLGITDALTHDRHFEQAGFRALLRHSG